MYTLTKADMLAQLAGLQQEIHQLHRSARQDRRHFSLLERRFSRLQTFNDLPQLQAYRRKLENDRSITAQITRLRAVANAALCDYEKHRVATLCRAPAQTNAYLSSFDNALQLEIAAADIKPAERVLLVGSGALPTTALALVARLSASVICYDCDPAAQRSARRLTRHLELTRQIRCIDELNDLTERDLDHIIIASLVADKQTLLTQLRPLLPPRGKLLLRYGNGLKSIFNCPYHHQATGSPWRISGKPIATPLYDLLILEPYRHA
ncbi:nicotianamine synthase [Serratia nevei]|uniref:nicotianamine synthase family protein n=1 Tax=Serratia nevei TaxID=2703794 RepID=UPI00209ECA80|nr:nicotianamine synthase family protein [Serratia nevei]MCP1106489.1 nicotianamine synthase [Serratia nevei]